MNHISSLLRSNPNYLKTCILYEVLDNKPVFYSYKSFCNKVGPEVMSYNDFDYWYYRFYNGELNFDHDRSTDPKQRGFSDLPVEILKKIVKDLDPVDRAPLRCMSKLLKAVADSYLPIYNEISVELSKDFANFELNDKEFFVHKTVDGCFIKFAGRPTVKLDMNYLEKSLKTLSSIWNHPGFQVATFSLSMSDCQDYQALFNCLPDVMHVKHLKLDTNAAQVTRLLPHFKAGVLESIYLEPYTTGRQREFVESEQWKQAKRVTINSLSLFNTSHLPHFYHFESFKIVMRMSRVEQIVALRDILLQNPNFQFCHLKSKSFQHHVMAIGEALGAEVQEGNNINHRHWIPESKMLLVIKLDKDGMSFQRRAPFFHINGEMF
ncbi:hypothetical protein GCK72_021719 [Caenorhabditis remanei]|uniref:F-box domain-containing protein n=1 Tax=Caenorhabditis remanei TaxID=31234 RepID=A0A6A5GIX2_CAERE|nr:hypothetical protein GCK72_021719 [Caenorhabditis remanei]KAF1755150.1 hypothetical protein GCK72_021719 [Caenorhabditis remanei]